MSALDPLSLPRLPRDADGPVFAEPWQAQAFALTLKLHEAGRFTWSEWAETLGAELATDPSDDGSRYYDHWVAALEALAVRHGMTEPAALRARKAAWVRAYRETPHGKAVELPGTIAPSVR